MAAHVTECASVGNEYFKSGYRIQFGFRPPVFNGVVATLGHQESEKVFFNKELQYLLAKRAIEKVPLPVRESGYYSQFFIVSKKRGGLHSILDLRGLNSTLRTYRFKMLNFLLNFVSQIQFEDWFVMIDRKDAYCHIKKTRGQTFSLTGSETDRSHGDSGQCHSTRLSAHETIPVLVPNYAPDRTIIQKFILCLVSQWTLFPLLHGMQQQESLHLLCPLCAFRIYVHCSGKWRKSSLLLVYFCWLQ